MNGFEYFKNCIINNYANFDGRARRSEYWYFTLFSILSFLILYTLLFLLIFTGISLFPFFVLIAVYIVLIMIPTLAVTVRRLHDTGKSGWWYLISFLPLGGLVLFIFTLQEGNPFANEYGTDPKGRSLEFEFETIHNQKI